MVEFVKQSVDEYSVYINDDVIVGSISSEDGGTFVFDTNFYFESQDLSGGDYIAIGKKLNELNGVSDE